MTHLLDVTGLAKHYPARDGRGVVKAVNGVSFSLKAGETLGIVGESGSGKSTLARLILRLIEPTAGAVRLNGADLLALSARELRAARREAQMVFQDPYASLDPRMTIAAIIAEPLDIHAIGTPESRKARVRELLDLVGLGPEAAGKYPHEFSGGQRQRIGIARAIALQPKLLILDEPVSALDVSIQAQILNLLADLKARMGLTYIFISHDLAVVRHISDRVAVMYLGRIVEEGRADHVLDRPQHPYTMALASAMPGNTSGRIILKGEPPNPESPPPGCAFHPRCLHAEPQCRSAIPELRHVGGQSAACHAAPILNAGGSASSLLRGSF